MIEIRKIQEGDLEYAMERAIENEPKMEDFNYDLIDGYTALLDGKILMVGGVMMKWEGVGEVWAFMTEDVRDNLIESYRCLHEMFDVLIKEKQLRRVEASSRADFLPGQNMLEHLGFEYEGCKRKHSRDGTDVYIYGKIL
ncbi:hypothetical protein LCGC14_0434450 [marine sediment metagenome]|uniref:N-acetyltransferase domain-containing protein n=1 Tax=marine sediment metagenome TaxID=412755 RepID=A0A0F9SM87_9ZZZZ